jgi:hypothetical protein
LIPPPPTVVNLCQKYATIMNCLQIEKILN